MTGLSRPTTPTTFSERRLERACNYVSDMWFPANPKLVARLKDSLSSETAPELDTLLSDISGDFSLFLFCLKELLSMLRQEGVSVPEHMSPSELLKWGGIERLRSILAAPDAPGSRHSFDSLSDAQRQRLEEVVISTSTAQVLAKHSALDPDLGFSAALLRQLGYTLIAWNYPDAYQRALAQVRNGLTLELALTKVLGFSPTILALTLARRWGITRDLYEVLTDESDEFPPEDTDQLDPQQLAAVSATLARLCRVGEALARANAPQTYPTARSDWETAKVELYHRLGTHGLELVQDAIDESCDNYTTVIPTLFAPGAFLNPEIKLEQYERENLITRNPYVSRCRSFIRHKLEDLYSRIQSRQKPENTLRYLVHEIIPEAGFVGGMVYSVEPATQNLVGQLKIGDPCGQVLDVIPANPLLISSNLIIKAFNADETICAGFLSSDGIGYTCLAGYLGFSNRIGVLYLEIPDLVFRGSEEHQLTHFKAFCLGFNDCLELL